MAKRATYFMIFFKCIPLSRPGIDRDQPWALRINNSEITGVFGWQRLVYVAGDAAAAKEVKHQAVLQY